MTQIFKSPCYENINNTEKNLPGLSPQNLVPEYRMCYSGHIIADALVHRIMYEKTIRRLATLQVAANSRNRAHENRLRDGARAGNHLRCKWLQIQGGIL